MWMSGLIVNQTLIKSVHGFDQPTFQELRPLEDSIFSDLQPLKTTGHP
jgi:hypothetical protein